ncbi:MAG: hypothetical protein GY797_03335 [Deltaproteobacteria bacterium]|nr:hypothetical protein [Deltaproteobacteria bacterium]
MTPETHEKNKIDTINILVNDVTTGNEPNSAFPMFKGVASKASAVALDAFDESLSDILRKLQSTLDSAGDERSSFSIDEAQFNLAVNGHGEVSLVGKAGGGVTAGITVTLRRRNA